MRCRYPIPLWCVWPQMCEGTAWLRFHCPSAHLPGYADQPFMKIHCWLGQLWKPLSVLKVFEFLIHIKTSLKLSFKKFFPLSLRFINMLSNFPSSVLSPSDRECSLHVFFDFALVCLCFCLLSCCIRWSPDTLISSYLTQAHLPIVPLRQIWSVSLLNLLI